MSRPATDRLKVNPPLGVPPELEWVELGELTIDESYQRSVHTGPSQSLIRKIAMYWDWSLCQPLNVARRGDGTRNVVDGQHRLAAARLRRDIPKLPCVITTYENAGDEAAAFVALNQSRRPLSALDLFKAAIAAEDTEALLIHDCITSAGLTLAPHSNNTAWKLGQITYLSSMQKTLRSPTKGEAVLRRTLIVLARAYPKEAITHAGTMLPGIAHIIANEHMGCMPDEIAANEAELGPLMIEMVAASTQREWQKRIVKAAPDCPGGRREASVNVFVDAWSAVLDDYFEERQ